MLHQVKPIKGKSSSSTPPAGRKLTGAEAEYWNAVFDYFDDLAAVAGCVQLIPVKKGR
jgi:hypothetical protein